MLTNIVIPFLIVISGFICLEYSVPIAIGELIAGTVGGLILDSNETPWVNFLSQLGLVSLMFLAGFEIDIPMLRRNGHSLVYPFQLSRSDLFGKEDATRG